MKVNTITKFKSLSMTESEYLHAENEYDGFCVARDCLMYQHGGCEPDMEKGPCEFCDKKLVYGIPQLLIYGRLEIIEDLAP